MKMVSTSLKPEAGEMPEEYTHDPRPKIYLDDDMVEALGITGIPTPGAVFRLQAVAVAHRVSAEVGGPAEGEGSKPDVELCLVLTEMGMEPAASNAQRATVLYGDD